MVMAKPIHVEKYFNSEGGDKWKRLEIAGNAPFEITA